MATHLEIVKALNDLGAKEWTLSGDDIKDIIWYSDDVKTEAEIREALGSN
jgi:hypothetical protein